MTIQRRSTRARRRAPIRNIKQSTSTGINPDLEYIFIRHDLVRIILMGGGLLAIMVVLAVLNVF